MQPADLSVIVPVFNGGTSFRRCLDALLAAAPPSGEILIIDDGSTDASPAYARERGLRVMTTPTPKSGPAAARNLGASAVCGDILFFIDADVLIPPDAMTRVAAAFDDPDLAALFGSYDDAPDAPTFIAQYKNLLHHYTHQTALEETTSFWAGCGAIRRAIFLEVGGFSTAYARPSIEDIELGYRLQRAGCRVKLLKSLQVKHLKQWTFRSMLSSDIFDRAIPWSDLLLRDRTLPRDLNLQTSNRISALLCWLLLASLIFFWLTPWLWLVALVCAFALIVLNADLYRFFYLKRGLLFTLAAIPLHWLYYLYSSAAFAWVLVTRRIR